MKMRTKKSKRLAIMMKHRELVAKGQYFIAYKLLRLLNKGNYITLYFGDYDMEVERILEKLGCQISIDRRGYAKAYSFGYK
jgi:hypothetical protein